jgi:hypothetical protein
MAKKAYEKPKLSKINLKADESVLTACKGPGRRGPGSDVGNCRGTAGRDCWAWNRS